MNPAILEVGGQRLEVREFAGNDLRAISSLIRLPTSNLQIRRLGRLETVAASGTFRTDLNHSPSLHVAVGSLEGRF